MLTYKVYSTINTSNQKKIIERLIKDNTKLHENLKVLRIVWFKKIANSKKIHLSFIIEIAIEAMMNFFSPSLSACSLWLWHCLDAVYMLDYMYLDQSRCFISSHWSIILIVCANKCFQSNNFFLSCSCFLTSSCSFHFTLSFSIVIFLLQFKYFSSTLALRFFQSWW